MYRTKSGDAIRWTIGQEFREIYEETFHMLQESDESCPLAFSAYMIVNRVTNSRATITAACCYTTGCLLFSVRIYCDCL